MCMLCAVSLFAQAANNKTTGILLVHYGTGNDHSRSVTIDKLDSIVAERFADCKVVEAYAAPTVIRMLGKRGIKKLSIPEALDSLYTLGCKKVVVQSTMLLDGVMTDLLKGYAEKAKGKFGEIMVERPLLYSVDDCRKMIEVISENLSADESIDLKNSQVVLVGHGSDSPANAMYSQLDYLLKDEGRPEWHVGTIEGYPTIENVERQLKKHKSRNVVLVPLLYIAGNHQKEDINGVWKDRLQKQGYKVVVVAKGLGEMPEVQEMILKRITEAHSISPKGGVTAACGQI